MSDADRIRVIHVDDSLSLVELVSEFLTRVDERLSISSETSPLDALHRIETTHFDAVVSDFEMPGMNGLDLLDAVREINPKLPFFLYTGKGSEEIASEAISRGVTEYMQKGTGVDQYRVLANRIVNGVQRYRAERLIDAEHARFQAVFDRAFDAMIIADDDGRICRVNSAACDLFERDDHELLGRIPAEFTIDEYDFDSAWETFRSAERERGLFPLRRPDGTERVAEYAATRDIVPGEHLSVLRDVTDQQLVEEQLRLERERLREFAGVLTHDLTNPVQIALGGIELLREEGVSKAGGAHLDTVERAIIRIEHIIGDVVALSKPQEAPMIQSTVEFSEVARRVWERVRKGTSTADIAEGIVLRADRTQLERLLTNLFRNAIEHAGTSVHVTVGPLERGDGFYVEDDGPGIPVGVREDVFEWTFSTKESGAGVGLKSVQQIVDAAGWEIEITSGQEGGARFEISGTAA